MVAFFKERLTLFHFSAMLFSAAGLYFICGGSPSGNLLGIFLAFSSGCVYVFYILMLKQGKIGKLPLFTHPFA